MPKLSLTLQQVTDLREDGALVDLTATYSTELDIDDGPGSYWTWVIRRLQAGQTTYWRTLYRLTGDNGEMMNSLFDGPAVVFEQVPAIPTMGEGYVRFDGGAVAGSGGQAAPKGQGVRP